MGDPPSADPDKTSEVHVDPWTGRVLESSSRGPDDATLEVEAPPRPDLEASPDGPSAPLPPPESLLAQVSPAPADIEIRTVTPAETSDERPADRTVEVEPTDYAARLEQQVIAETAAWPLDSRAPSIASPGIGLRGVVIIAAIAAILGATLGSALVIVLIDPGGHRAVAETTPPPSASTPAPAAPPPTEPTPSSPTPAAAASPAAEPTPSSPAGASPAQGPAAPATQGASPQRPGPSSPSPPAATTGPPALADALVEGRPFPSRCVLPIRFRAGSAEVESRDNDALERLASRIQSERGLRFQVVGYVEPGEVDGGRLALRRAMVAVGIIGRLGPSRRRFHPEAGAGGAGAGVHVLLRLVE